MTKQLPQIATKRLIDSVWTLGYELNEDNSMTILFFGREEPKGYEMEGTTPFVSMGEQTVNGQKRTVVEVKLTEREFWNKREGDFESVHPVTNPEYIFNYPENEKAYLESV